MEINLKLVDGKLTALEQSRRADGSVVFYIIQKPQSIVALVKDPYRSYGAEQKYNLSIVTNREVIEAVYILRRLSDDYYQFISTTAERTDEVKLRSLKALNEYIAANL